jgi:hypothetical protein
MLHHVVVHTLTNMIDAFLKNFMYGEIMLAEQCPVK